MERKKNMQLRILDVDPSAELLKRLALELTLKISHCEMDKSFVTQKMPCFKRFWNSKNPESKLLLARSALSSLRNEGTQQILALSLIW